MPGHRHWRRNERGTSALEFALVAPILVVVVFGIVNLGVVLAQQISLNNGARQAARFAVVDPNRTCAQIQTEGTTSAATLGMPATQAPTPVLRTAVPPAAPGPASCPAPCAGSVPGTNVHVTMTRTAAWLVPFPPFTSGNAPTLTGTGVMRCEFS